MLTPTGAMHDHAHAHTHVQTDDARRLTGALALILGLMAVEIVAGILASSLALLSDAAHMLTDAGAIALALFAARLAQRPARGGFTFGFRRAEILSAELNGATLVALAVVIAVAAIHRLIDPPDTDGGVVLVVALVGIAVNLAATMLLAGAGRRSLNVEGAFQHVLTDLFAFVATAIAGAVVLITGLLARGWHRRAGGGRADAALGRRAAARVRARAARGGPARPRPAGDRQGAGGAEPRGRGARPARVGGHLRLPRDLGARDRRARAATRRPTGASSRSSCATASA